ncbi:hypothetical protein U9M48_018553 [Paspalum notatum var. saurae]|uniref:DUF4219 domain-containing protein n=1 Tax=Paspalum notatum var. saurae TaxID=547442 RepID=A0AAQ3TB56_PASNO
MFGDASSSRGAVAERVVASTNSVELPLLTSSNYQEWALVMKVSPEAPELLQTRGGGDVRRAGEGPACTGDHTARRPDGDEGRAGSEGHGKGGVGRGQVDAGRQRSCQGGERPATWKQFENITWRDEENAGEFAVRVTGLVGSLREMGETIAEPRVVKKILRVVPRRLKQVAVAVEMFADLDTAKIEEVIGRLRVAEDADKEDARRR